MKPCGAGSLDAAQILWVGFHPFQGEAAYKSRPLILKSTVLAALGAWLLPICQGMAIFNRDLLQEMFDQKNDHR
jgi:hypothetical protein